jgi:hypothetical protein
MQSLFNNNCDFALLLLRNAYADRIINYCTTGVLPYC